MLDSCAMREQSLPNEPEPIGSLCLFNRFFHSDNGERSLSSSPYEPPVFPPIKESDFLVAVAQLARYDEKITKEYTLITDRMNWLVVSESFIFTIFAASIAAYDNSKEKTQKIMTIIIIIMPLLGALIAALIIKAINAADIAIVRLKKNREAFEKRLPVELRIDQISYQDDEHRRGNIPTKYAPVFIVIIWIILLISTIYNLPIRLNTIF